MKSNTYYPSLRMIEFNGKWSRKNWVDTVDISTEMVNPKSGLYDDLPHIGPGNIQSFTGRILNNVKNVKEEKLISNKFFFRPGNVIYSKIRPQLAKYALPNFEGLASADAYVLSTKDGLIPEFLFLILHGDDFYKYSTSVSMRTGMPKINREELNQFSFYVPSLAEQKQIGMFFKYLNETITLHQQELETLKKTKQGFLQKMFPKEGEIVPEIRFSGFDKEWTKQKVSELFRVTRGQVLATSKTSEKYSSESPYPVYSSQTKNNGLMGYYNQYLFDTAITWTTDGANAGTVNFREGKFYSTNVNGVLLSEEGYANKAVAEALNLIAWKYVSKVGNPKLMNNVMGEIYITIPVEIEELNVISNFLEKLDKTIELHEKELESLKETKKAFLQKMFV